MRKWQSFIILILLSSILSACSPSDQGSLEPALNDAAIQQEFSSGQFPRLLGSESLTAILSGTEVGQMEVVHDDLTSVEYEYRSNGRGPTVTETIEFSEDGFPETWEVSGATTFGNIINEDFQIEEGRAFWTDTTGTGDADIADTRLYVAGFPAHVANTVKLLLSSLKIKIKLKSIFSPTLLAST